MRAIARILIAWAIFAIALAYGIGGAWLLAEITLPENTPALARTFLQQAKCLVEFTAAYLSEETGPPQALFHYSLTAAGLFLSAVLIKFCADFFLKRPHP